MTMQGAEQCIADCHENKSTSLNLANLGLTELPSSLFHLRHITHLDLSENGLDDLPEKISNLPSLEHLNIRSNRFLIVPSVVSKLTKLTFLDISMNRIGALPDEISNLENLTWLDLGFSNFHEVPEVIFSLRSLQHLELHANRISVIPDEITFLSDAHRPHFFRQTLLNRYQRKGRFDITCDVSLDDVDVRTLLREVILVEADRHDRPNIYVGGDYIDVGNISASDNIIVGRENEQRMGRQIDGRAPYRRLPPAQAGDFSRPFLGQPLALDGLGQEQLHGALLSAFNAEEMRRLLNFKLNRRQDEISMVGDARTLFFNIIDKSVSQGWTGALVEQAFRVNSGNELLGAFVVEHMAWLLAEVE